MAGKCCFSFSRFLIGFVNLLVIICAVVAGVVVYTKEKNEDWSKLLETNLPFVFILIAMGFACFSAFIGFFVWTCKKRILYISYLVIIIIVICIEIAGIVLAFIYKDEILDGIKGNWLNTKVEKTRIFIEKSLHCCGYDQEIQNKEKDKCAYKSEKPQTCYDAIDDAVSKNMKYLQIGIIVMCFVELLLFICACYLVCKRRKARVEDFKQNDSDGEKQSKKKSKSKSSKDDKKKNSDDTKGKSKQKNYDYEDQPKQGKKKNSSHSKHKSHHHDRD